MLWSLSWKNIWRNKLRSTIVMITIALGIFAGIFLTALMNGMVEQRIKSIIQTEISHIQIHKRGFQENNDFSLRIINADSLISQFGKLAHVKAICKRIVISSIVASAETNTGVKIVGIIPDEEKQVTNIHQKLIAGTYFESNKKNTVIIGQKLADKLKISLHKKIIITVQDANSNITSGAFRVSGIFETKNNMYDESTIFIKYNDICSLTGLSATEAHEIAILLDYNEKSTTVEKFIQKKLPEYDVMDWTQLSPEAGYLVSAMNQYMAIFMIIILISLFFGIVNTMLMVVLERVKELGMLMAVGMNRAKVFFMIMLETIYLSVTGGVFGITAGYFTSKYFETKGLNLYFWKDVYESVGYSSIIYPKIDFQIVALTTLMVVLTGVFSAIYPAWKALKLNPAEATRSK